MAQKRKMSAADVRQAISDSLAAADVQRVMKTLLALAESGDVSAAKLLLERGAGKPAAAPAQHQHIHVGDAETPAPAGTGRVLAATVLARIRANEGDTGTVRVIDRPGM